jgi:CTD small phosphatase-like protein 2
MPTKPFLPASVSFHRHYLILDLDETLIHYSSSKEAYHIRPFASQFLENISKYYELTVFTAATKEYAD